jgi:kallikrein
MKMASSSVVLLLVVTAFAFAQQDQELNKRIKNVFGLNTRGFDEIVEPEVEPTQSPQFLNTGGQTCKCVPYWQCDNQKPTATDSRFYGEIDVRFNPDSCQDVLDVCCPQGRETEGVVAPPPPPPPTINPAPTTDSTRCGIRNTNGIDFSLVGHTNEAGFGEFPWMVALLTSQECLCGGSLIHPNVVLTGAHCVFNVTRGGLKVRAGEWDTQTTKERLAHQEREVNDIIPHEDFNSKTLANDIVSYWVNAIADCLSALNDFLSLEL